MTIYTVDEALQAIEQGKLIAVATDTVFGIIGDGSNEQTVSALYTLKNRDKQKSVVVFLPSQTAITDYAHVVPVYAQTFMQVFWPGPLTLVVQAKKIETSQTYLADPQSIALRVPNDPQLLALLQASPKTIIATSANMSGEKPCTSLTEAQQIFGDRVLYWDNTATPPLGTVSSVIDARDPKGWQLLREGAIAKESLWQALDDKENKGVCKHESSNWQ